MVVGWIAVVGGREVGEGRRGKRTFSSSVTVQRTVYERSSRRENTTLSLQRERGRSETYHLAGMAKVVCGM